MKTYKQGDTIRKVVKFTYKGTGEPVNLMNCTAFSQMRNADGELVAEASPSVDVANGLVIVEYTTKQTAALEPGGYGYDIRLKSEWRRSISEIEGYTINDPVTQSGKDVLTIFSTKIKIEEPYTEME